ncbi:MAG TPA: sugar ABC transporter permease [Rectinemataceae bacterium]
MAHPRAKKPLEARRASWGWFFVGPAVIFFSTFSLYPMLNAMWTSFHTKKLLSLKAPKFVGFRNYERILSSPDFWNSVRASLTFCLGVFVPLFCLSLLIGVLVSSRRRGRRLFQLALYSPAVLSSVVTASVWIIMFDPRGLANQALNALLGTPGIDHRWLSDPRMVQISTIVVYVWKLLGYYVILFVTGIGKIPVSVIEAATIDGANAVQRFFKITLPLLKPTLVLVSVLIIIGTLKSFSTQYLFAQRGAPLAAMNVITLNIYNTVLSEHDLGKASAMSILLFLALLGISWLQIKASEARGEEADA